MNSRQVAKSSDRRRRLPDESVPRSRFPPMNVTRRRGWVTKPLRPDRSSTPTGSASVISSQTWECANSKRRVNRVNQSNSMILTSPPYNEREILKITHSFSKTIFQGIGLMWSGDRPESSVREGRHPSQLQVSAHPSSLQIPQGENSSEEALEATETPQEP